MYNEQLESLISAALAKGWLSDKDKQVLFKKAEAMGIDHDEFEIELEARLVKRRKEIDQELMERRAARAAQQPVQSVPPKQKASLHDLDELIQEYLADGFISAKERQALLQKARRMGLDSNEADLYIDAQQQKADNAIDAVQKKRKGKTCPYCDGDIPELTEVCPHCGKRITPEASNELEEIFNQLEDALVNFKSGDEDNISRSKAEVERYIRKARMYYSTNPKVQNMLKEIKEESDAADRELKKNARNEFLVNLVARYKWFVVGAVVIIILAIVGGVSYHNHQQKNNPAYICNEVESLVKEKKYTEAEALMVAYSEKKGTHVFSDDLKEGAESLKNGLIENGDYDKVFNSKVIKCSYGGDSNGWGSLSNMYPVLLECIEKMKGKKTEKEIKSFIDIHIDDFSSQSSYTLESEWKEEFLNYKVKLYAAAGIK